MFALRLGRELVGGFRRRLKKKPKANKNKKFNVKSGKDDGSDPSKHSQNAQQKHQHYTRQGKPAVHRFLPSYTAFKVNKTPPKLEVYLRQNMFQTKQQLTHTKTRLNQQQKKIKPIYNQHQSLYSYLTKRSFVVAVSSSSSPFFTQKRHFIPQPEPEDSENSDNGSNGKNINRIAPSDALKSQFFYNPSKMKNIKEWDRWEWVFTFASVLQLFGFLSIDAFHLRIYSLISALSFMMAHANRRFFVGWFWAFSFAIANLITIYIIWEKRYHNIFKLGYNIDKEAIQIYQTYFQKFGITPYEFLQLLKISHRSHNIEENTSLTVAGMPSEKLYLLLDGTIEIINKQGDIVSQMTPRTPLTMLGNDSSVTDAFDQGSYIGTPLSSITADTYTITNNNNNKNNKNSTELPNKLGTLVDIIDNGTEGEREGDRRSVLNELDELNKNENLGITDSCYIGEFTLLDSNLSSEGATATVKTVTKCNLIWWYIKDIQYLMDNYIIDENKFLNMFTKSMQQKIITSNMLSGSLVKRECLHSMIQILSVCHGKNTKHVHDRSIEIHGTHGEMKGVQRVMDAHTREHLLQFCRINGINENVLEYYCEKYQLKLY